MNKKEQVLLEEPEVKKAEDVEKRVVKNIDKVLNELYYIEDVLRKKALAQLQRNYGLILVPKTETELSTNNSEEDEEDKYLYEWNPEYFKEIYRIPKFREKVEEEIKKCEDLLNELKIDTF